VGKHAPCILVIDDDPSIRRVLETGLRARGYRAVSADGGEAGIGAAAIEQPDVIVLDLGLPDLDGVTVCQRIRTWSDVPIIVLSAHGAEERKIEALDEGADDFVTKPFSMKELLARVRVALRHRELRQRGDGNGEAPVVRVGDLELDSTARRVTVAGADVELTEKEFDILEHLMRNVGRVVTHDGLLSAVWGPGYADETHYLRVYVNRLRRKLEADPKQPRLLVTLPRVGYRIDPPSLTER
jgi:two-component system KDP operon response regulator KdpE